MLLQWRHSSRQGKPLGRDERKWLSHYDLANDSPLEEPTGGCKLQHCLIDALRNAEALLVAAKSDRRSIAEALKMTDADAVLGTDDEAGLEDLRWYVYPKECASMLAANSDHLVHEEKLPLAGALDPIGTPGTLLLDRKRTSSAISASAQRETAPHNAPSSLIFFRDGEHAGEAPVEEVRKGIDDGELSEKCEVYVESSAEWVLFSLFVRGSKKVKQDTEASCEASQMAGRSLTGKKASRDSRNWGKGNLLPQSTKNGGVKPIDVDQSSKQDHAGDGMSRVASKKFKHTRPPPKLMRLATQAVMQWDMIQDGDRLLLGLSGGKDSLSLLHCLLELNRKLPITFELEVCTIDPMTPSFDPSPLISYVESLGLRYHYIRDDIVSRASSSGKNGKAVSSLCAFCARMKRGNLYSCARKNSCNKLVLAQHLDDCAESFVMSFMHNGFLRTMKANYKIDAGDISVIRPLVYCRESLMTEFAKTANLPVINENCPACFEEPKERARVKKLLSREETLYSNLYDNIRRSLLPLMHDDTTPILRAYTEEAVSKSRKGKKSRRIPEKTGSNGTVEASSHALAASDDRHDVAIGIASDDALVMELARRRANRFRRSAETERENDPTGIPDQTGQVCSLNGGDGKIPCVELME